jgi:hypothetical protein
MKLIISYITLVIIILTIINDILSGEINLRGSVFYLDTDRFEFIAFELFKFIAATSFVIYYKFIDTENKD